MASVFHNLLSQPQFDSLDFADVRSLTKHDKAEIIKCLDTALSSFLSEINFSHCISPTDSKLRDDLWSWSKENLTRVCICDDKVLNGILDEAAAIAEYYYPLAHHDTRLQMAIGLAAGLTADDGVTPAASRKAFASFHYHLWCGVSDSGRDEWSTMYLKVIRNFARHFGGNDPRMGTIGANGWAGFARHRLWRTVWPRPCHRTSRKFNRAWMIMVAAQVDSPTSSEALQDCLALSC